MNDPSAVSVLGVYTVPGQEDVHLLELRIDTLPSAIEVEEFTQEDPSFPKSDWQVAYDEKYLNESGDQIIGDWMDKPSDDNTPTRLTFFMHFLTLE